MLLPAHFLPFHWHLSGECVIVDIRREQQVFSQCFLLLGKENGNSADPY